MQYWPILVENEYLAINHPTHLIVDAVGEAYDHTPYRHFCDTFHRKMTVDSFFRLLSDFMYKNDFLTLKYKIRDLGSNLT